MGVLKDGRFWAGVIAGYLFLVLFPQFNVRTVTAKPKG
jgi:hypothetical protein